MHSVVSYRFTRRLQAFFSHVLWHERLGIWEGEITITHGEYLASATRRTAELVQRMSTVEQSQRYALPCFCPVNFLIMKVGDWHKVTTEI